MRIFGLFACLGFFACAKDEKKTPQPVVAAQEKVSGPKKVVLTIKAPPDQLVETPQGLWLKAGLGTKESPVVVKDGPASIAELGFECPVSLNPVLTHDKGICSAFASGNLYIDRTKTTFLIFV